MMPQCTGGWGLGIACSRVRSAGCKVHTFSGLRWGLGPQAVELTAGEFSFTIWCLWKYSGLRVESGFGFSIVQAQRSRMTCVNL